MDVDLPPGLRRALDDLAQGRSQRELARRAEAISQRYRSGAPSREAVRGADDALAYAFTRMPATYAATSAVLAVLHLTNLHFGPRSLIDAGAGPGTAAFAAVSQFAGLESIRLIDHNTHLRALGRELVAQGEGTSLREATYDKGDLTDAVKGSPADLVMASYTIGELASGALLRAAEALWAATRDTLVVIEPGTPAGFARIRTLRAHLIARGAHTVAPCPHDLPCPIVDPDWCHFSQRLPRSREHRQMKEATLAFEDEKFSYVALSRTRRPMTGARVLAHPRVSKVEVSAKLCTTQGIVTATASRRDRERYGAEKRWSWGDQVAWPEPSP